MSVDVRESRFTALRREPFDAIAELAQGWDMEYHQLEAGPNPSDMIQLRLDGIDVGWERLARTVLITGSPPPDSIVFGLRASSGERWVFRGREADSNTLCLVRPGQELDVRFQGGLLSFVAARETLESRLGSAGLRSALVRDRVVLPVEEAEALRSVAFEALRAAGARPEFLRSRAARDDQAGAIRMRLENALRSTPDFEGLARRPGPRPARFEAAGKADELIRTSLHRRLAVRDLAEAADVGERALHAGFVERFGHGPLAHMRLLRLNAVRRALRAAAPAHSVTWVASRFGVRHFGRFACRYRELFGETPSATLKSAQRRNRSDSG